MSQIDQLERKLGNTDNTVARRKLLQKITILDGRLKVVGNRYDALRAARRSN